MKLTATAEIDNKMTLDGLEEFVERARANSIPGTALVHVRINLGGTLREISVDDSKTHPAGPRG